MRGKNFYRKLIYIITMVLFCVICPPLTTKASTTYNSSAALNYASNHWNDGKGKCAEFVSDCIKAGGCNAWSVSASTLLGYLKNSGMGQLYELNFSSGQTIYMPNYSGKISAGDPVFYYCSGCTDGKPYVHTVLCNGADSSGYMKAYSHNNPNSGTSRYSYLSTCYECGGKITKAYVYHFNTNQSPRLTIDSAQANGDGTITIRGWAFDPDNPSASVTIHTYIGGDVDTPGVEGWQYVADLESSDVNIAYGISGNHRFNATIKTAKRGSQGIVVYALDTNKGTNAAYGPISVVITNTNDIDIVSSASVDEGKSKSISFTFHGDGIHQMAYGIHDESIISATWTDFNWDETKGTITVNGLKEGKTVLDICFLDDNGKEFYKEPVTITVNHVHKYTIEKVTKEATCSSTGLKKYYCSCGAVSSQTTTIAKKSHTYVTDAAVAATCTKAGKTVGKHCSVCGYVLTKQETIAAKGHSYVTDAAVAATCTQAGKTAGKHCSVCGYVQTKQETIAAKGHTYVTDAAVEAMCTEAGKTAGKHCSVCGYVLTKQETIAAKGHSYITDSAKAATCTETGKTEGKHCSVCGYVSQVQDSIPMLSHSYENGICIWCGKHADDAKEDNNNPSTNTDNKTDNRQDVEEKNDLNNDDANTEQNDLLDNANAQEDNVQKEENEEYVDADNDKEIVYFEKSNLKFKIIDAKKKQVMVLRCLNKKSKKIIIPSTIRYSGVTYSVVSITANAFSSLKNLEVVTIGKNITTIGRKAFYNCKKMKAFHIKSTKIKKVEKDAFGKLSPKCRVYVEDEIINKYKKILYKSGMNKKIQIS